MQKVGAVILAAGSSTRFGENKIRKILGGKEVWQWSYERFAEHPEVHEIVVVHGAEDMIELPTKPNSSTVKGGETRKESAHNGVRALSSDIEIVLVHDAARPLVSKNLITIAIEATKRSRAAVPGLTIADTIKEVTVRNSQHRLKTLDRDQLIAVQTPQGGFKEDLLRAYHTAFEGTDDTSLLENLGIFAEVIEGERRNIKLTTAEDFDLIVQWTSGMLETRTGTGYDIHSFSQDPERPLFLGGIKFEGAPGLEGHSDADVLIHAIVDALLGAAAMGDIGVHYPPSDDTWKNVSSLRFLAETGNRLRTAGWGIVNIDATLLAEIPKVMPRRHEMIAAIAESLQIEPSRINVKATTNEKLGAIGRSEGIAALASATVKQVP
jgi:2-C-methyl-D-erythritol 4-phosphate cytidylyltransferase/2-C-methyl-D-erythritol 2,4-cyclodiphosphate synthase